MKYWSKTQANIVLSTAEAEQVALVKGVCEAKKSLADERGIAREKKVDEGEDRRGFKLWLAVNSRGATLARTR